MSNPTEPTTDSAKPKVAAPETTAVPAVAATPPAEKQELYTKQELTEIVARAAAEARREARAAAQAAPAELPEDVAKRIASLEAHNLKLEREALIRELSLDGKAKELVEKSEKIGDELIAYAKDIAELTPKASGYQAAVLRASESISTEKSSRASIIEAAAKRMERK